MTTVPTERIRQIEARHAELTREMSSENLPADRFVALSKEYAELNPVADAARGVRTIREEIENREPLVNGGESCREMVAMAREELETRREELPAAEKPRAVMVLPKDVAT